MLELCFRHAATALAALWMVTAAPAHAASVVRDPVTGLATYISGPESAAAGGGLEAAWQYIERFAPELGVDRPREQLRPQQPAVIGKTTRYGFQQVAAGRRVLDATVAVTLGADDRSLEAISSSFVGLDQPQVDIRVDATAAANIARRVLPAATSARARELVVLKSTAEEPARLVWLVDVEDPAVESYKTYAVNAADGFIEDSAELRHSARDRVTTDAQTDQVRREDDAPIGSTDADRAHDYAGNTWDMYFDSFGFDSLDGAGLTIRSFANNTQYQNNAWYDHNAKTLSYSPGFAAEDVVAHEYSHGVIDHTAGLVYRGQSGALNESFADVFAVLVDDEDWLLGEDLPAPFLEGRPALRRIDNPSALDQPGHVSEYRQICGVDNDGVHTNSGIPNRAFYEVVQRIGRGDAGRIYFRALGTLAPQATFSDARTAIIAAAQALFSSDPVTVTEVEAGLEAAGMTADMQIQACPTSSCPIAGSASRLDAVQRRGFVGNIAAAYRLRDEVLRKYPVIGDYTRSNYASVSGDLASAVFTNPGLALQILSYVRTLTPVINRLGEGELTQHRVDAGLIEATNGMLEAAVEALEEADKAATGRRMQSIVGRFRIEEMVDMTYQQAMDHIREVIEATQAGQGQGSSQSPEEQGQGQAESEQEEQGQGRAESEENEQGQGQAESEQDEQGQRQAETEDSEEGQGEAEAEENDQGQGRAESEEDGQSQGQGQAESEENDQGEGRTEQPSAPRQQGQGNADDISQPGSGSAPSQPRPDRRAPPVEPSPAQPGAPEAPPMPMPESQPGPNSGTSPEQPQERRRPIFQLPLPVPPDTPSHGGDGTEGEEPAEPEPPPNCC